MSQLTRKEEKLRILTEVNGMSMVTFDFYRTCFDQDEVFVLLFIKCRECLSQPVVPTMIFSKDEERTYTISFNKT